MTVPAGAARNQNHAQSESWARKKHIYRELSTTIVNVQVTCMQTVQPAAGKSGWMGTPDIGEGGGAEGGPLGQSTNALTTRKHLEL